METSVPSGSAESSSGHATEMRFSPQPVTVAVASAPSPEAKRRAPVVAHPGGWGVSATPGDRGPLPVGVSSPHPRG